MKSALYLTNNTTAFRITANVQTVGRAPDSSIVLEHESVSRNHARIQRQGDQLLITDLESRNGTFVNSLRIEESAIAEPDDLVAFAQCKFRVVVRKIVLSSQSTSELGHGTTLYRMLQLSKSQRRVLRQLLRGKSEKEIAAALHVSQHTVHCHVRAIYQGFEVSSRAELMSIFIDSQSSLEIDLPGGRKD